MLLDFFYALRAAKLPISVKEHSALLEALDAGIVGPKDPEGKMALDDFYHLARMTLVKDEKHFDKFDRAFGQYFHGIDEAVDLSRELPAEWLRKNLEKFLSDEEKAALPAIIKERAAAQADDDLLAEPTTPPTPPTSPAA